ncbi:MAG: mono/diheme cytochrome c family protein [Saprospiraceae bacterium]|jgi:mono/diheme cytochrome c family protein
MKKINKITGIVALFIFGLGITLFVSCFDTEPKKPRVEQAQRGKAHFEKYCVACHGTDARGIHIDSLSEYGQPKDLTQIVSSRGGGDFPIVYVAKKIDGRNAVKAHGPRTMPVWGDVFVNEEHLNDAQLKGKLGEIIAYLMSIQKGR